MTSFLLELILLFTSKVPENSNNLYVPAEFDPRSVCYMILSIVHNNPETLTNN